MTTWLDSVKLLPGSAKSWECLPEWKTPFRQTNEVLWYWVEKGTGHGWIGSPENKFHLEPGDLFLIPQNAKHAIWHYPGREFHQITVHFRAQLYVSQDLITLMGLSGTFRPTEHAPFAEVSKMLAGEFYWQKSGWRQAMTAGIWRVLLYLCRHYGHTATPVSMIKQKHLQRLMPTFNLIDERLNDPLLSVAELAASIHVSEVQFRKLFLSATDSSPVNYLRQRRIEKARQLIRETSLPMKTISESCGFSTLSFFHRVFRDVTGMTPRSFKDLHPSDL